MTIMCEFLLLCYLVALFFFFFFFFQAEDGIRDVAVTGVQTCALPISIGISATPIRWERDPHRTARVVIFIVAPIRDAALYLQVVGAFARTLAHPDTVLGLLAARSPEQVVALAALDAVELPSQLTVRDVMTPQAITVGPERTLGDVEIGRAHV